MIRPPIVTAVLLAAGACARTAAPPPRPATSGAPSTDIYVYSLSRSAAGSGARLVNVTHRAGYDNQPYWDGNAIFFTSVRAGQADIYRIDADTISAITRTAESEYSPALTPDGAAISVVRVERDSTQRLWRMPLDAGAPSVLLPQIKPVGYYAWLDSSTVALYVLGAPDTLEIADVSTGAARVVTTDVGRSIQRVPGGTRASFVRREGDHWVLRTTSSAPGPGGMFDIVTIAPLPDSAEYVTWRSATELYTASGSRVYRLRLPGQRWEMIADLAGDGLGHISRLAVSPDGQRLALVAEDRP